MNFITQIIVNAGMKLFVSVVNEEMVIWGFLRIADNLAARTTNKLDDELVTKLKETLKQPE